MGCKQHEDENSEVASVDEWFMLVDVVESVERVQYDIKGKADSDRPKQGDVFAARTYVAYYSGY